MTRNLLALSSAFVLVSSVLHAMEPVSSRDAKAGLNQIYIKVIMPGDAPDRDKERPVVESWIAEDLKKRGQAKFFAVTGWVPMDLAPLESTDLWNGVLGKDSYCPVGGDIERTTASKIKVHVSGWSPGGAYMTIPLTDEPGSRVVAPVEDLELEDGMPHVAILVAPPVAVSKTPVDRKR